MADALGSAAPARRFRYSLSIGWFFTASPVVERFGLARRAGFRAVELFWPDDDPAALRAAQRAAGVDVALLNMWEGDYAAGDRGFACDPGHRRQWRHALDAALELATALSCTRVNVLAGDVPAATPAAVARDCFVDNLRWAAPRAASHGVTLVVEPLNHLTHPRYLCQRTADVVAVLDRVGHDNVGLQYDVFHAQRSEGNLLDTLTANIDRIAHVQVADVPTRSAPGTGEVNVAALLGRLAALGYDGFVGLEYDPSPTPDPFAWLPPAERARGW